MATLSTADVESAYALAKARYAAVGVDTDAMIKKALETPISLHCWQVDDVNGFETKPAGLDGGGILSTGGYPGRATNAEEARMDLEKAISLIPGTQRLNLHASYAETGTEVVDRDALEPKHFANWINWGKKNNIHLDFNPTYFAHPKAQEGFTLSSQNEEIRAFWIKHGVACRKIAEHMSKEQGSPCVVNWWIPDGSKDLRADRMGPRARLIDSYDKIFAKEVGVDATKCVDYVESKLFGIGSEEYVVGSAEFYADYACSRQMGLCLDMGHFHPTETIHDKIATHLNFIPRLLLHVSRPIRWDSDHIVLFNDDTKSVMHEINRCNAWDKVTVALDFFDASINRIGSYIIGTRAARKCMLSAMLEPSALLQKHEAEGRFTHRLALMEEFKSFPFGAVWDMLCLRAGVPIGSDWLIPLEEYEATVQSKRKV